MPPPRVYTYHPAYLELACQIEDAGSALILNPRDVNAKSLDMVDRQFLTEKNQWRTEKAFWSDYKKRDPSMR